MLISGERVRQARELRGMTQASLGKATGVSQGAIAQIEAGSFLASDDLVTEIARQTHQSISFFQQSPAPEFQTGSLLFRSHAAMGKKQLAETYRHAQLAYEVYLKLQKKARVLPVKISNVEHRDPVSAASHARRILGLDLLQPVPHLLNVLEWHGVTAVVIPDAPFRDAFSLWNDAAPIIALAAGRSGDRSRMSVAHELGHLIMHRGMSRFEVDDEEAEEFAAEFLLPAESLRQEIKPPVTLSSLANLKPRWRVSIQALVRCAKNLGIITDRQYRYLFEQLSSVGWRKSEPIKIVPELPRALRQMAEMLYGDPVDARAMAEDLCLKVETVREMIPLYAGKAQSADPVRSNVVSLSRSRRQRSESVPGWRNR
jgi:Zn-dependent peptidase ImmA (M78 family)/transcriptional regulator with XRE-family HTH domain